METLKNMGMQSKSEDETCQITWIILQAAKTLHIGKNKLAAFLKGSKSKEVQSISEEPVYGGIMWHNIATITSFIEQLESMELLKRQVIPAKPFDYSFLELTEAGKKVLEEKIKVSLQVIKNEEPITVGNSERQTLVLIKTGKKISEIAKERTLAESTIYSHIFRLIQNGYMQATEIISKEVLDKVAFEANKFPDISCVKEIKEKLPELSYGDVLCAVAELRKNKRNKFIERIGVK